MMQFAMLLAQATSAPVQPGPAASIFSPQIFGLILAMVVFWWLLMRGQKKERQKAVDMMNALKKGDRVQTIGGILGTIVDVRDNEVVLKVDESSNTKIRFNRAAIKEVLVDASASSEKK